MAHALPFAISSNIAPALPRRPDPRILSDAIPLFFIAHNRDGLWVVREVDGPLGGLFLWKRSALQFIRRNVEPGGYGTMILTEPLELDIENRGSRIAVAICAAKRLATQLWVRWTEALTGMSAVHRRRSAQSR